MAPGPRVPPPPPPPPQQQQPPRQGNPPPLAGGQTGGSAFQPVPPQNPAIPSRDVQGPAAFSLDTVRAPFERVALATLKQARVREEASALRLLEVAMARHNALDVPWSRVARQASCDLGYLLAWVEGLGPSTCTSSRAHRGGSPPSSRPRGACRWMRPRPLASRRPRRRQTRSCSACQSSFWSCRAREPRRSPWSSFAPAPDGWRCCCWEQARMTCGQGRKRTAPEEQEEETAREREEPPQKRANRV